MSQLEQYSRLNNVEIGGITVCQGEKCTKIIELLSEKVGCPVSVTEFDTVHRGPTPVANQKNIIVRLCLKQKRAAFVSKARKARLTTSSHGLSGSGENTIFINEHLTPQNKKLLSKAHSLKNRKEWMFVWTDNCVIKARKTLTS